MLKPGTTLSDVLASPSAWLLLLVIAACVGFIVLHIREGVAQVGWKPVAIVIPCIAAFTMLVVAIPHGIEIVIFSSLAVVVACAAASIFYASDTMPPRDRER